MWSNPTFDLCSMVQTAMIVILEKKYYVGNYVEKQDYEGNYCQKTRLWGKLCRKTRLWGGEGM
jgi:hypothetical protein